jgi:two-component system sensor histidine kinase KdpD
VSVTSSICFLFIEVIGYQSVALILMFVVSVLAILFDIIPVLISSILSALIWNFFFIPPVFTFHIGTTTDNLMFLMYFVIALINAALTFKIREFEKKAFEKEEKEKTILLYNTLINSLSHELKTPLSAIIGSLDTLQENEAKLSANSKVELYKEMETASFRLNRQVENLLNLNRLEAGVIKPTFDWFYLDDLIQSLLKDIGKNLPKQKIIFTPKEEAPLIKLDRGFLEIILQNLLHNAILHTPSNSTIKIDYVINNETLNISVSDNGLGFPKDKIRFVFDKFYKIDSNSTGGTGLGLSIVKGFTEALNGVVSVENKFEGGALFNLSFPVETSKFRM